MLHPTRRLPLGLVIALATLPSSVPAKTGYIPDQVIVRYKQGASAPQKTALHGAIGGPVIAEARFLDAELVQVKGMSVEAAIEVAKRDPNVLYAEPNWPVQLDAIPNDANFAQLYGMHNTGQTGGTMDADIDAAEAWDVITGDQDLMIGVIDTGVDYNHPDLAQNMWTNTLEADGTPGVDDDGNGYIDDIHGFNFVGGDGDPMDDHFHGTHCAGTIGAVGNNGIGVAGVNWRCSIVAIKFLNASGAGTEFGAAQAIGYAIAVGVKLTSNSWGGSGGSQALHDAVAAAGAAGQLFVAAAGNSGRDTDSNPNFPSSIPDEHVIAVAATDHNDARASFSNYGATSVDLGAPGVNILSCYLGGTYQSFSGTSMATPHVAGVCALVMAGFPGISALAVKDLVLSFAEPIPALEGRCLTGGRLRAIAASQVRDETPPSAIPDLHVTDVGSTTAVLEWTATGDDGTEGAARRTELRYSTSPIDESNFAGATLAPTPLPHVAGTVESVEVSGLDYSTAYFFAIKALDDFGNFAISNVAMATTLGTPAVTVSSVPVVELFPGGRTTRTFDLTNSGQGRLDFSIPLPEILPLDPNKAQPGIGQPSIAAYGGPDGFGYRWSDSDQPNGVDYEWIDIQAIGTPVQWSSPSPYHELNQGPFPLGFDFPYYGRTMQSVRIVAPGYLTFNLINDYAYFNEPLPHVFLSDIVAPFWDGDLYVPSPGNPVLWHSDGTRFVVTWLNVPYYGPGNSTFQVILYPSGEIRFQYRNMTSTTTSATVGVSDRNGPNGLLIAFNQPYVHEHMAVRIFPLNQWMDASPGGGRLTAGQTQPCTVAFDAAGLAAEEYHGTVHLQTNAPGGGFEVPVTLRVSAGSHVHPIPEAVDFGVAFLGGMHPRVLVCKNTGNQDLVVTDIDANDPTLSAAPTSFTVVPGASQNVTLTYAPTARGPLAAAFTIHSNDPDEPARLIAVSGSANDAPVIAAPGALDFRVAPNSPEERDVEITNLTGPGGATLEYTIIPTVFDPIETSKAAGVETSPRVHGGGGPDAFGYRWVDSDSPEGPIFDWIDITTIGTRITIGGDEQTSAPCPIGFPFPFYGQQFESVKVCTNGFLSFTSSNNGRENTGLPNTHFAVPKNLVAPFWDDCRYDVPIAPSRAFYHSDGDRFVLTCEKVWRWSGPITFQVILYPGGRIVFQYRDLEGLLTTCTVGIQDATGTRGLQIARDEPYVHNDLAIRIEKTPQWLQVQPAAGSIPAGSRAKVQVVVDPSLLGTGNYLGRLRFRSNDPARPVVDVPVGLEVISPTDIASERPITFDLEAVGANPSRGSVRLAAGLPHRGMLDVRIYNVRGAVVRTLVREPRERGRHSIFWDGLDDHGRAVASGTYWARSRVEENDRTVRVTLLR